MTDKSAWPVTEGLPRLTAVLPLEEDASAGADDLDELVGFFERRGLEMDGGEGALRLAAAREELRLGGPEAGLLVTTSFAGPLLALLSLENGCGREDALELVERIADRIVAPAEHVALALFRAAVAAPLLVELPPALVVETMLRLLTDLSPATSASLWRRDTRLECAARAPEAGPTRRERDLAGSLFEHGTTWPRGRGLITGLPIMRWDQPVAALVARVPTGAPGSALFLRAAADALGRVLNRQLLLERNAERERALVDVAERRLLRLGLDLHDGPIQDVIALAADLRLLRRQADGVVGSRGRPLLGRFEDLQARLVEMESGLRQISHTLEPPSMVGGDLGTTLRREVAAFEQRHGIIAELELEGELGALTDSQHIAIYRLVQEALSNVREHACASRVSVRLAGSRDRIDVAVADDGCGFDVDEALVRAGRKGRLGLIGMSERIRLLGGHFHIATNPESSTTVSASLPRWLPVASTS
ncbi:MAG TPA: ATP-binding protein [Gaiellaceae bacterium]|jgi:signal transduction histidine kinase|nr:ATP-binding protein [Gaiellaceae bacterium]